MASDFRWFSRDAQYDENTGEYTPASQGALSRIGMALQGGVAPFIGDYEFGARQAKLELARQQADREFRIQMAKMKAKEQPDPFAMALLGAINPEAMESYAQNFPGYTTQSPDQLPGLPTPPRISGSLSSGFVPESIDLGAVNLKNIGYEGQKAIIKKEMEEKQSAQQSLKGSSRFIQRLGESYNELNKVFPNIGDASATGKMQRYAAQGLKALDKLPKTEAFLKRTRVLANAQARNVEGGRVTDADREVYADAMANALGGPTEENIILASDAILDMRDKGGNIGALLNDLSKQSDHPVIGGILQEILSNLSEDELKELSNAKY